jgi:hypothetical protein
MEFQNFSGFNVCILQVNYLADDSLEIFDDPAALAMSEVFWLFAIQY